MKTTTLLTAFGLSLALAGAGFAQDKEQPKGAAALLKALDRNGDGALQQIEIDMAVVVLRRMDRNEDGTVSAEEMIAPPFPPSDQPRRPGAGQPDGQRQRFPSFAQLDKDGDGNISKEEAPERMQERFAEIDTNGDGMVDKTEQETLIQRMRERFQQGGGAQRPGGRDRPDASQGGGERPKRPAAATE